MQRTVRGILAAVLSVLSLSWFLSPALAPAQEAAEPADGRAADIQRQIEAATAARRRAIEEQLKADPAWRGTHKDVRAIPIVEGKNPIPVHNFCLNRDGNLLVCCGENQIRVVSQEGKLLDTWKVDLVPQAICVHTDGAIFVGGGGKIARLSPEGKTIATATSPVPTRRIGGTPTAFSPGPRRWVFSFSSGRST